MNLNANVPTDKRSLSGVNGVAGLALLLIPLFCYALSFACFAAGFALNSLVFPIAVAISFVTSIIVCKTDARTALRGPASALLILFIGGVLLTLIEDHSFDGRYYHQEIILSLDDGWNPLHEPHYSGSPYITLWEAHYAKAMEIAEATVVKFSGFIESGKVINLCIIAGSALLFYSFLPGIVSCSKKQRILLTLLAAFNPIGLSQLLTYYIDFTIYYFCLLTIITLLCMARKLSPANIAALAGIIIMAAGTKLTTFFYVGLTIFAAILWLLIASKRRRLAFDIALIALVCAAIGVLLFGYHPYITNWKIMGNPLYPLAGEGAVDIMKPNTPLEYLNHNRFRNFFDSLTYFNRADYETRKGGFSPYMIPLMFFAAMALCVAWKERVRHYRLLVYIAAVTLASCFIFEQSWWARYINFIWLFPLAGVVASCSAKTGFMKYLTTFISLWGIFAGSLGFIYVVHEEIALSIVSDRVYQIGREKELQVLFPIRSAIRHFEEHDVKFKESNPGDVKDNSFAISIGFYQDFTSNTVIVFDNWPDEQTKALLTHHILRPAFHLQNYFRTDFNTSNAMHYNTLYETYWDTLPKGLYLPKSNPWEPRPDHLAS